MVSLAGSTRSKGPPSFHCGVAITARRPGALLTGLATALGPGSAVPAPLMLTLLRVPILVLGRRVALLWKFYRIFEGRDDKRIVE
jgi:hypothetical protein